MNEDEQCMSVYTRMDPKRTTVSYRCEHRGPQPHQHYTSLALAGRGRPVVWGDRSVGSRS